MKRAPITIIPYSNMAHLITLRPLSSNQDRMPIRLFNPAEVGLEPNFTFIDGKTDYGVNPLQKAIGKQRSPKVL